MIDPAI